MWESFSFYQAAIVFFAYFIIDFLYASYIIAVEERKAGKCAVLSALIYSLLSYGVLSYSENQLYLIPLIIGAFFGTYTVVKMKRVK